MNRISIHFYMSNSNFSISFRVPPLILAWLLFLHVAQKPVSRMWRHFLTFLFIAHPVSHIVYVIYQRFISEVTHYLSIICDNFCVLKISYEG